MVGRVGYAPTTPAMSMQYSTIELTARYYIRMLTSFIFYEKCLFLFIAYINEKLIINKVILKLLKKDHLVILV